MSEEEKTRFINLKKKFLIWCEKTTFHAIPNIVNNDRVLFKLMWSICLIASICYCCRILTSSIIDYYEFKVLTKFEIIQESYSLFPVITFCNLNKYDLSKDASLYQLAYSIGINSSSENNLDPREELKQIEKKFLNQTNSTSLNSLYFQIEDMLLSCRYNQQPCNKNDFKRIHNQLYGNCYVFNSNKMLSTSKYGPKYGLEIELYIGSSETSSPISHIHGAVLFISNQTSLINQIETGIELIPGSQTNIAINRMLLSKLPGPYNDCYDIKSNDYQSEYSSISSHLIGSYSQSDCLELCYQMHLLSEFKCLDSSLNYFSYLKSYYDVNDCSNLTNSQSIFNARNLLVENELCSQECPNECESILYRIASLSASDYPSKFYEKFLMNSKLIQKKFKNKRIMDFKSSLLAVNVYYESDTYEKITQVAETSFSTLLANLGGQFGLFLGISLLSFLELIELCIWLVMYIWQKLWLFRIF